MAEETAKTPAMASTNEEPQQIPPLSVSDVPLAEGEEDIACPKTDTCSSSSSSSSVDSPVKPAQSEAESQNVKTPVDEYVADDKNESLDQGKTFEQPQLTPPNDGNDNGLFPDHEKKALAELKTLLQNAIHNGEFHFEASKMPVETVKVEVEEANVETVQETEAPIVESKETEPTNQQPKPEPEPEPEPKEAEEVKKVNIDEDGTKTVEAIEETVVSTIPEPDRSHGSTPPKPVSLWGIPLLEDDRTDTILWKFLRARDFRVKDAFTMIKNTLHWRVKFGVDNLIERELDQVVDLDKYAFMHGVTKEGHPVCYNVYGVFQNKEIYQRTFSDEKKRENFLKWRVQLMEKSVRKLDFRVGGVSTIVQVNDLKDSPGPGKWELRQATKQALHLFQDNYPEFVAKQVFINVPWWYMAVNKMISPFLTQRTKSKFVVVGPSKSAETLFNYIAPEQVPIQYGGLSKEGEFGIKDGVNQIIVKPTSKEIVEFAVTEACHLTWEMRVLGWEVSYGAEFVPNAKDGYTVIIQKIRKVGSTEETIITNSFKTSEPGKIVLTIDNSSSKKKRLLYRLKSKPSCD